MLNNPKKGTLYPRTNPDGSVTTRIETIVGSIPDFTEWWTEEDWIEYNAYVEQTKLDGTFGTTQVIYVTTNPNPLLDGTAIVHSSPLQSHSLKILDLDAGHTDNIRIVKRD